VRRVHHERRVPIRFQTTFVEPVMRIAKLSFSLFISLAVASGAAALPNPNVVRVDCNAGGKVQPAVDANSAPFDIVISGICTENVVIRDKDVNLRGAPGDPTPERPARPDADVRCSCKPWENGLGSARKSSGRR